MNFRFIVSLFFTVQLCASGISQTDQSISLAYIVPAINSSTDYILTNRNSHWGVHIAYTRGFPLGSHIRLELGGRFEYLHVSSDIYSSKINAVWDFLISEKEGIYKRSQLKVGIPIDIAVNLFNSRLKFAVGVIPKYAVVISEKLEYKKTEYFRELPNGSIIRIEPFMSIFTGSGGLFRSQVDAFTRIEYIVSSNGSNRFSVFTAFEIALYKEKSIINSRNNNFNLGIAWHF